MREVLIDGDILIHKVAHAVQEKVDWGDGMWSLYADEEEAVQLARGEVVALGKEFKGEPIVCLSDKSHRYFRHEFFPEYKADRRHGQGPLVYMALRDRLADEFRTVEYPSLEADDVLGILGTSFDHPYTVIVSSDKDLDTIPGYHAKGAGRPVYTIDPKGAMYNHLLMTLVGDSADGYPGCPGVGPKKAEKILAPLAEDREPAPIVWEMVLEAFANKDLDDEYALIQARCAYILHAKDYLKGVPELWDPASLWYE